jgi:hypothetical protein
METFLQMNFIKISVFLFCAFLFFTCNNAKKENENPVAKTSQVYDPYGLVTPIPHNKPDSISYTQLEDSLNYFIDSTELKRNNWKDIFSIFTFGITTLYKSQYAYIICNYHIYFYKKVAGKWQLKNIEETYGLWGECRKMDLDQDGFKDLVIGCPDGTKPNTYCLIWMWDKSKHDLICKYPQNLISNIAPDTRPGYVRGYTMFGLGGNVKSLYKLFPDSIQLVAECNLYSGWVLGQNDSIFISQLKNGKMIETKYCYRSEKAESILLHFPWYGENPWLNSDIW